MIGSTLLTVMAGFFLGAWSPSHVFAPGSAPTGSDSAVAFLQEFKAKGGTVLSADDPGVAMVLSAVGDPRVLRAIERLYPIHDPGESWVPMQLLASSDAPAALELLKLYFREHPDHRADFTLRIVGWQLGRMPVSSSVWDFLEAGILPTLSRDLRLDSNGYDALAVWAELCDPRFPSRVEHLAGGDLERRGCAFLDAFLRSKNFVRLMMDPRYAHVRRVRLEYRLAGCENYQTLFRVAESVGTTEQVDLLTWRLKAIEKALQDPEAGKRWPKYGKNEFYQVDYESGLEQYWAARVRALAAMRARPAGGH